MTETSAVKSPEPLLSSLHAHQQSSLVHSAWGWSNHKGAPNARRPRQDTHGAGRAGKRGADDEESKPRPNQDDGEGASTKPSSETQSPETSETAPPDHRKGWSSRGGARGGQALGREARVMRTRAGRLRRPNQASGLQAPLCFAIISRLVYRVLRPGHNATGGAGRKRRRQGGQGRDREQDKSRMKANSG